MKINLPAPILVIAAFVCVIPRLAEATSNAGTFGVATGSAVTGGGTGTNGGVAIGAGYSTDLAPTNGLIVQGSVGIGTPSASSTGLNLYATATPITIIEDGTGNSTILATDYYSSPAGGDFTGAFARGSYASPSAVQVGDRLGGITMAGYNGSYFSLPGSAAIEGFVDAGTISTTSLPAYLDFETTPNGSITRAERMRIDENGNVGIGTTTIANKLDINGAASVGYVDTTAPSSGLIVSGNVGIGTASPLKTLEVYDGVIEGAQLAIGATSTDGLLLANTTAATVSIQQYSPRLHFTGQGWKTATTAASEAVDFIEEVQPLSGSSAPTGNLVWSNSINGSSYGALMTLTSGGLFGIATASPNAKLTVSAATVNGTDSTYAIRAMDSSNSNKGLIFGYDDTLNAGLIASINSGTAWTPTIINASGAFVGIGTTTPAYALHVYGTVAGSAYVTTSDIRFKKNIEPLQIGLNEVEQLQPVTFELKDSSRDVGMEGKQIGFVAQDVEKILPSIVVTAADPKRTKGMKYSELIPVLTKAIQELKADNDKLASRLSHDEATISTMKTKLDKQ